MIQITTNFEREESLSQIIYHGKRTTQWTPSAAYMRQGTGLALFQIMACRLIGAKPLPEPLLIYCQLHP